MNVNSSVKVAFGVLSSPKQAGKTSQNQQLAVSTTIRDSFAFTGQQKESASKLTVGTRLGQALGKIAYDVQNLPNKLFNKSKHTAPSLAATESLKNTAKDTWVG